TPEYDSTLTCRLPPTSAPFPYTTLFRSFNPLYPERELEHQIEDSETTMMVTLDLAMLYEKMQAMLEKTKLEKLIVCRFTDILPRSEEHTSELQSRENLVCRLLLEKKNST